MFSTAEIRWFARGGVPDEVTDWYNGLGFSPFSEQTRTDHYLFLPGNEAIGIKMREGKLEFKQRTGIPEKITLQSSIEGNIELYQKWSFDIDNQEAVSQSLELHPSAWLSIEKSRTLFLFSKDDDKTMIPHTRDTYPDRGCGLELTRVRLLPEDERWWTMGFEAFGTASELIDDLVTILNMVMTRPGLPRLSINDSFGYAALISKAGPGSS